MPIFPYDLTLFHLLYKSIIYIEGYLNVNCECLEIVICMLAFVGRNMGYSGIRPQIQKLIRCYTISHNINFLDIMFKTVVDKNLQPNAGKSTMEP